MGTYISEKTHKKVQRLTKKFATLLYLWAILNDFNKYLGLLLLAIAAFWVWQWDSLSLPYFWDELGVYAPSALYLVDNGISLLPESLPSEYSRGHPMFCVFLFSTWMKTVGSSPFFGHLFALLISSALLVATYIGTSRKVNSRTGFWAATLLMAQPVFIAQSTLILPEILLTFLLVCAFFAYLSHRWIFYIFFTSLALLTKETALVLPFACFLHSYLIPETPPPLGQIDPRLKERISESYIPSPKMFLLAKSSLIFAPLIVFALFLIVQKIQNGWFFFPYHTDLISLNPTDLWEKIKHLTTFLLREQGRFLWPVLLIFHIFVIEAKTTKSEERQELDLKFGFSFEFGPLFIYLFAFAAFFVINFFMERYTLLFFPILCVLVAEIIERLGKSGWGIWLILMVLPFLHLSKIQFNNDADLTYRKAIELQQNATKALEEKVAYDRPIYANFPIFMGLKDTRLGYVQENFSQLNNRFSDSCQIVVKTKPGSNFKRLKNAKDFKEEDFNLIWSEENPIMSTWIYERIEQ